MKIVRLLVRALVLLPKIGWLALVVALRKLTRRDD